MINPIPAIKSEVERTAQENIRRMNEMEEKARDTKQLLEAYKAQLDKANDIVQDMLKCVQKDIEKRASMFNDCIQALKAIDMMEFQDLMQQHGKEDTKGDS